jgi:hypothetical protein
LQIINFADKKVKNSFKVKIIFLNHRMIKELRIFFQSHARLQKFSNLANRENRKYLSGHPEESSFKSNKNI